MAGSQHPGFHHSHCDRGITPGVQTVSNVEKEKLSAQPAAAAEAATALSIL